MPSFAACSGTRLSGVMPGWVLTSSRNSPSTPRSSSQRKSERDVPLHPSSWRSEEHTSELQSLMRISYAVFCLKTKTQIINNTYKPTKEHKVSQLHSHTHNPISPTF